MSRGEQQYNNYIIIFTNKRPPSDIASMSTQILPPHLEVFGFHDYLVQSRVSSRLRFLNLTVVVAIARNGLCTFPNLPPSLFIERMGKELELF